MKKINFILPISLIVILLSPLIAQAGNFGVEVGDTFTYDCVESTFSVTLGSNSGTGSGYLVDDHHFDVGTSVVLEVLDFDLSLFGNYTIFEVQAGSYTENSTSSNFAVMLGGLAMILYPMLLTGSYINETAWNQTEVDSEPGMIMIPFVEPGTDTWNIFKDLSQQLQTSTELITGLDTSSMGLYADYSESATEFFFESYANGTYSGNVTEGDSIVFLEFTEINHHFQLSYDYNTGVMNGMRLEGSIVGTSNDTALSLEYNMQTEIAGYDLPDYQFGTSGTGFTWPFPGFGIFAAVGAISSLFLLAVVIRKRK